MNDILNQLGKHMIFFDGAMGTLLQKRGLRPGEAPERWNLDHPEIIQNIHEQYLAAGADIITANTFGANPFRCMELGLDLEAVVTAGISIARKAIGQAGRGIVALDIGPSGRLLAPMGDLWFEDAVAAFSRTVKAGIAAGADCILIETMNDLYEVKAALLAAKENASLPVFVTVTFDMDGRLLTGADIKTACAFLEGLRPDAIGMNCGLGPQQMVNLIKEMRRCTSLPLIVNPNAGLPKEDGGVTYYHIAPADFAGYMRNIAYEGAWAVGGCCGTTPEHLRQTVELCRDIPCRPLPKPDSTIVTSGSQSVEIGLTPVIIGERINPTGKSRFKQALRDCDLPYILGEGIAQQDAGAHILDVNVGLPEIDEREMMCRVVTELQSISSLPLQIDTSDLETMASAMRIYNGKPLVNSVTAKQASMRTIFPLVKKYGGVVIGLTITDGGIPETARGRADAARLIVETAAKYGIDRRDIIIDPLTMAVSADHNAAQVTLEALELIQEELGVRTSLGVSNISFGLPQRENVTSAFFLMALQCGLNAAIMNPLSESMMRAYRSYCALAGWDANCMSYIEAYSQSQSPIESAVNSGGYTLCEAIEKGLKDMASQAAAECAKTMTGLEIIDRHIIPALDQVGRRFEAKSMFLPQLLMSADAAKAAFDVIRAHMGGQSSEQSKLTIVIATVKGDVHDIGKNIVRVLLENYGFRVIDLGKDVPPEKIVDTAIREGAGLVGLSALMTTTVANMKETIRLLRQRAPGVKIMVGGAVLTQEYAGMIDADFYGPDAMASVRYAMDLAGNA